LGGRKPKKTKKKGCLYVAEGAMLSNNSFRAIWAAKEASLGLLSELAHRHEL
jgi:hypothetical protein